MFAQLVIKRFIIFMSLHIPIIFSVLRDIARFSLIEFELHCLQNHSTYIYTYVTLWIRKGGSTLDTRFTCVFFSIFII